MDLCNLYDFYTFVFTLAFTPCTFNVLFYVRIKYYNNRGNSMTQGTRKKQIHFLILSLKGSKFIHRTHILQKELKHSF